MFTNLVSIFEKHVFGILLVFILWLILYEKKTVERISKPKIKYCIYFVICIYYALIIVEIFTLFN